MLVLPRNKSLEFFFIYLHVGVINNTVKNTVFLNYRKMYANCSNNKNHYGKWGKLKNKTLNIVLTEKLGMLRSKDKERNI